MSEIARDTSRSGAIEVIYHLWAPEDDEAVQRELAGLIDSLTATLADIRGSLAEDAPR